MQIIETAIMQLIGTRSTYWQVSFTAPAWNSISPFMYIRKILNRPCQRLETKNAGRNFTCTNFGWVKQNINAGRNFTCTDSGWVKQKINAGRNFNCTDTWMSKISQLERQQDYCERTPAIYIHLNLNCSRITVSGHLQFIWVSVWKIVSSWFQF